MKKAPRPNKTLIIISFFLLILLPISFKASAQAGPGSVLGSLFTYDTFNGNPGTLFAIVQAGGNIYLGGSFTEVGYSTGPWAALSTGSGTTMTGYSGVLGSGTVWSNIPDGSGGWFVGGDFTCVAGGSQAGLVHLEPNGTLDPAWNADLGSSVTIYALALSPDGTQLFAGGFFSNLGGINNLAEISASTGLVNNSWAPNPDQEVYALAVDSSGTTVFAGGAYVNIGGVAHNGLAAIGISSGLVLTGWNAPVVPSVFGVEALLLPSGGATLY